MVKIGAINISKCIYILKKTKPRHRILKQWSNKHDSKYISESKSNKQI